MKNKRQGKILELISKYDIGTQEKLMEKLHQEGFEVTQATISRDIRELKLSRVITGHGTYRYILHHLQESSVPSKFNGALAESIVSVDYARNVVVIKTYPGMAQAVATGVDTMDNATVLGCVAGDDTIMVVARDEDAAENVAKKIKYLIKSV